MFEYRSGEINEKELLIQLLELDINKKNIISFVGAGGKTSLIYKLASELGSLGKKVIVTTTTHMFMPENDIVITGNSKDIESLLKKTNVVNVGMLCDEEFKKEYVDDSRRKIPRKIKGVEPELAKQFIKLADFVLVEADGSKRLPLKVPANHEPVIFEGSNLVIGVCGIDAIGKSIKKICHRPNLASILLDEDEDHIINEYDIAKILSSEHGQRKSVKCDYKIIINKADTLIDMDKAKNISKELSNFGIHETIITTFKD